MQLRRATLSTWSLPESQLVWTAWKPEEEDQVVCFQLEAAGDGGEGRGQLESAPLATGSMGRSVSQSTTQLKSQALWPSRARVGHSEAEGNLGCGPPPPLRGIASPLEETGSREPPPWGRGTQPCPWEPHCGDGGEESVSVWRRSQPGGEGRKKNQTRSQDWYFCVCVCVCLYIFRAEPAAYMEVP